MASSKLSDYGFYFDDPRLGMSLAGRLVTRIISSVFYLALIAGTFSFLLSDLRWLRWFGLFLLLVLADQLIHRGEADKPLSELPSPKSRVNLARYLTPQAFSVLEKAYDKTVLAKGNLFLHILREVLDDQNIEESLRRLDVNVEEFRQKTEDFLEKYSKEDFSLSKLSGDVSILVYEAFRQSIENGYKFIDVPAMFSALFFVKDEKILHLLSIFSLEEGDLERAFLFSALRRRFRRLRKLPSLLSGFRFELESDLRRRVLNRAWTSRPTPTLDRYSTDFTDLARRGSVGFLIGHEEEYQRLVDTLRRPVNPNALLVGEAGIGKETIIAHLASQIIKDEVPPEIFDKRLVQIDISKLVAGATPEELHARLQKAVEEIFLAGNIILYIPDIHNLTKTSGTAYLSAADALIPIITSNEFPVIGSTYPREFKQYIEPRSDFASAFEVIRVNEISEEEAEKVLIYESLLLEVQTDVLISLGAVKMAVKIAKKHFRNKFLPSSASDLLKDAIAVAMRKDEKQVGVDHIISAAEEKINVPLREVSEEEAERLLRLEEIIHERLIDQEEAVKAVSDALRAYRSGLARSKGPIAAFLFVGPTGVGKTELAKILARIQFGSEDAMVRFDMTEYQDKQSFYRFIGSPDGEISGALTDTIMQKPYSLVLLDEFEKAYPDILDLFLQVFDDGRLTDNLGKTADFGNTIIIATSNAHSALVNEALSKGQSMADISEYLKKKLVDFFKPELLNRFSKIVVFKSLAPADILKIAKLNLDDLAKIVGEKGITLTFDEEAVKRVAKLGYDPTMGARPLRRVIDEKIKTLLSQKILKKEIMKGSEVKLTVEGEEFKLVV